MKSGAGEWNEVYAVQWGLMALSVEWGKGWGLGWGVKWGVEWGRGIE